MSDLHITLPSKPRIVSEEKFTGTYEIDNLYPGYGHTLGNSLRRIILASLPGAAITSVKIDGVQHEFSTIEGVKEDVITILLNLKKVRIKLLSDEPQVLTINVKGPKTITASDIAATGQVEVLNPEQHIAELTGKKSLDIEFTVQAGLGYVSKEELNKDKVDIGSIALDAVFSPIRRVNYEVENMRVGDRTDYNRLRIFIETDGTLSARESLEKSIEIMIHQLKSVIGFKEEELIPEEVSEEVEAEIESEISSDSDEKKTSKKEKQDTEVMKVRIDELKLSPRVETSLDEVGIRTIGGLVRKRGEDILGIKGMGQKGLQEIKKALSGHGLTLRG